MDANALLRRMDELLEEAKTGLLTTTAHDGTPRARWMTPRSLKGRPGYLYAVTASGSSKLRDLEANPKTSWLIQKRNLAEILTLSGVTQAIDNPSLLSEFLQAHGREVVVVWKINPRDVDLVVLETRLERGEWFKPMKGEREVVTFDGAP